MSSRDTWTEAQLEHLRQSYRKFGPEPIVKRWGKKADQVHDKAQQLGLRFGDIAGWERLAELARDVDMTPANMHLMAERAGVTLVIGPKDANFRSRLTLVPKAWARDVRAQYAGIEDRATLEKAGYLSIPEAAKAMRLHPRTIHLGLRGEGVARALVEATAVRVGKYKLRLNPHDVERVRVLLDAERYRASTMVTAKALWIQLNEELGTKRSTVNHWAQKYPSHVKLLRGEFVMVHLSHEDADKLLERFRRDTVGTHEELAA